MQRQLYLDVAKGIGIILVVLGHNQLAGARHPELQEAIFSFHMPLFFFASGMVFRMETPLPTIIHRRWITLLRPYCTTMLLLALAYFAVKYRFDVGKFIVHVVKAIYATGRYIEWTPTWFLPHLFLVNVVFWTLQHPLDRLRRGQFIFGAVFWTLVLVAGVAMARALWLRPAPWGPLVGLPFSADLLGISLFYFWLGFEFSRQFSRALESRQADLLALLRKLLPLCALSFVVLQASFSHTIDLNFRIYDHVFVSTLSAVLGIAVTLGASSVLARHANRHVAPTLAYLGRASLIILIFHGFIQAKSLFVAIEILKLEYWSASIFSLAGGLAGPLVLYEFVLPRIPGLREIYLPASPIRAIKAPPAPDLGSANGKA